ncbi:MAG: NADH:flavin oxidoreductase, partial [Phycisphaerae bacterium]|nr:NADH:flavin oxidoreductase [Phycisphaerae bacterium]
SVGGRRIGNRFAIHPMEGWDGDPDGRPTDLTRRRWRRFGASGAKLIWGGEAVAVRRDGRANPNQLFVNPEADTAAGLADLRRQVLEGHASVGGVADDLVIGLQLTHSGRFARPDDHGPRPMIAHGHPLLARKFGLAPDHPLLTDDELAAIGDDFINAAVLAQRAGFDFVDVKCCHGYLLHELLAAHTRPGRYGGSFENRTRLFRDIVAGVRVACPDLMIGVRLSATDLIPFEPADPGGTGRPMEYAGSYRYGFGVDEGDPRRADLAEPLRLLTLLESLGIPLVNITLGSPYYCPHVQRPAAYPPSDGYLPPEDPLAGVILHLRTVRTLKAAHPGLVIVGSGYSYLQEYLPHVAEAEVDAGHVDLVGLGRMVLSYPDLPHHVLTGRPLEHGRLCRTFSDCTTAPRHGLVSGCYPLDPAYKQRPEAVELKVIKKKRRVAATEAGSR